MPLQIVRNNIVKMPVDAIVNAANAHLLAGGGVCGAIFSAAGEAELQRACDQIGGCPTGQAVITPGFALQAKWIIHAVGPVWHGGHCGEEALLRSAYTSSLALASKHRLKSIAFPLISSGIYGYPKDQALKVAMSAIQDYLLAGEEMDVYLVVFDSRAFQLSEALSQGVQSYIDEHYVREIERTDTYRIRQQAEFLESFESSQPSDDFEFPMPRAVPQAPASASDPFQKDGLRALKELLSHRREETFADMLLRLIDEKGFAKDSIVYKRANLERSVFSKLRSGKCAPSKSTAIALAVALELNMDQARDLLARAGYALSPSSLSDVIVSYFIENGWYDILEINAVLFEYNLPCLGAKD